MDTPSETEIVVERPFPPEEYPRVWHWIEGFRNRVCDDYGPQTLDNFLHNMEANAPPYTWGVYRGTPNNLELGGFVSFTPINPIVGYAHMLFKKAFWGRRTTYPALHDIALDIFDNLAYSKIAMVLFSDNHPARALITALGAQLEGTLVGQTMRGGQLVDCVQYRLARDLLPPRPAGIGFV